MKESVNQELDIIRKINEGLGWMLVAFNEAAFEYFWKDMDAQTISKFRAHLNDLEKDQNNHFPVDKKEDFKKAADDFIKANDCYRKCIWFSKKFNFESLRTKSDIVYHKVLDLIKSQPPGS